MNQAHLKKLIESRISDDGMIETGIHGVKLFRATTALPCVPAVYEPCVIAIASGAKEAILDGSRIVYDSRRYLCCPMSMPVKAGTPTASAEDPLFGVYIALNPRIMGEIAMEMENSGDLISTALDRPLSNAIKLARWDEAFSDALLRLLQLGGNETDLAVLGDTRLRELYYAILKGDAGAFARQAFGVGNAIARSIAFVSSSPNTPISIDELAARANMSRAAFHRKFKQVTSMPPIQFVKSMRLNQAAMKIGEGMTVSEAAMNVGYVSTSQFSREFKRAFGQSPRQWSNAQNAQQR